MSLMYSPGIRLPRNPWSHGEAAWRKRGWNTDGTAISGPCPGMDAPQDDRTERIFDYQRATGCLGKRRSCMGGRLVSGVFSEECGFTIIFGPCDRRVQAGSMVSLNADPVHLNHSATPD